MFVWSFGSGATTVRDMVAATSFEITGNHPRDVRTGLEKALAPLEGRFGGGLLFLSGSFTRQVFDIGLAIREMDLDAPFLLANGAGVLTERGEREQVSACAGMMWQAGTCEPFALNKPKEEAVSTRLAEAIRNAAGPRNAPTILFASREAINPAELFDATTPIDSPLFGGGTVGRPGAVVVTKDQVRSGDVVGMAMRGLGNAVVRASPACEVLGTPQPVTSSEGALVLTIASQPALDVLRKQASEVAGQRPVVVAVQVNETEDPRSRVMIRGIRGIHESRGGVMVSEDIVEGTRVAFAVLDGAAAAADLEATLREASRDARGGAERFGLYIDCAGRGANLYGESGMDVQAIRRRFPRLPVAGIKSAFEIGPGLRGATTHLYSGVFCLFYAPS